jgi:hypothetical protein
LIQQPRYQNGQMRFIYFPGTGGAPPGTESGSGSGSSQQVINNYVGKFSGDGHSEILRYNRTAGTLDLLELSDDLSTLSVVPLEDSTTQQGHWGSSWEVYIGDFSGKGSDDLLLYDRKHGVARFLTFYSDLTINTDVVQTGWKSSWEIYVGNFDGSHDQLLFYDRNTSQDHGQFTPAPRANGAHWHHRPGAESRRDGQWVEQPARLGAFASHGDAGAAGLQCGFHGAASGEL